MVRGDTRAIEGPTRPLAKMVKALAFILLPVATPAHAGRLIASVSGEITGFEANPVTGISTTLFQPGQSRAFRVIAEIEGGPQFTGTYKITTPKDSSVLNGYVVTEYFTGLSPEKFGWSGISNNALAISASASFLNGRLVDVQFKSLDFISRYFNKPDALINVDGDRFTFGYDPVLADSFKDATTIGRIDYATARMVYVPEPANWAMMIAGFGMAGTAIRRRKTNQSFGLALQQCA